MPPLPQPYPPPAKVRGYRPPWATPWWEGEGWGSGAAKPPKPLPPLVLLAVFSARLLWWSPASSTGGGGGAIGGF